MIIEVGDIEVYPNLFIYVGHSLESEERYEYVLHSSDEINTIGTFLDRMADGIAMMGFNNTGYDYPVLHHMFGMYRNVTPAETCMSIYRYSNELIKSDEKPWFKERDIRIPQFDLYLLHHFNNKAKACGLKHIEIAMRMDNVEDLPFSPGTFIEEGDVKTVLDYCHHDVAATKLFAIASEKEIGLRKGLSSTYDLKLYDANDPKIGSEIILKFIAEKMGIPHWEIRKMRTYRNGGLDLNDIILPYVKFDTPEFSSVLDKFKNTIVRDTKGDLRYQMMFRDVPYDYGTGGIHACTTSGSYHEDEQHMIYDIDVQSYYPNLAIRNKKAPLHLGDAFCEVYETIFETRKTFAKGTPENYGLKIALNGVYGKSNDIYSYLYDPKFTMFITVNGQLLLSMLTEWVLTSTDAVLLQANTDGITVRMPRNQYDTVQALMKKWEELTGLVLEDAHYKSMFIRDVNNYIAVTTDDKYKFKGAFEIDKAWHKDQSHRIVAIAVARACIFGVDPSQTLQEHMTAEHYDDLDVKTHGIYDFCGSVRARGGAKYETESLNNGHHTIVPVQKTNRYFVSNDGVRLRKVLPPDANKKDVLELEPANQLNIFNIVEDVKVEKQRVSYIEAGHNVTMFNRTFDGPYNLNFEYYLKECNKILEQL
tara:strand:+ start:1380 stop:3320 length:1941 start_codon:yes stop_codon:yes gene_type:complete